MTLYEAVKTEIDKLDCMGLLKMGCPDDEYDIESKRIAEALKYNMGVSELSGLISDVFSKSFEEELPSELFEQASENILNPFLLLCCKYDKSEFLQGRYKYHG